MYLSCFQLCFRCVVYSNFFQFQSRMNIPNGVEMMRQQKQQTKSTTQNFRLYSLNFCGHWRTNFSYNSCSSHLGWCEQQQQQQQPTKGQNNFLNMKRMKNHSMRQQLLYWTLENNEKNGILFVEQMTGPRCINQCVCEFDSKNVCSQHVSVGICCTHFDFARNWIQNCVFFLLVRFLWHIYTYANTTGYCIGIQKPVQWTYIDTNTHITSAHFLQCNLLLQLNNKIFIFIQNDWWHCCLSKMLLNTFKYTALVFMYAYKGMKMLLRHT